jgi:hypothetical protein
VWPPGQGASLVPLEENGHDAPVAELFIVARNPDLASKLPYLLRLPLEGGIALKARESWPRSSRVYCYPFEDPWPDDAEVLERIPVTMCRRRGAAIDLVLDRPALYRSQFVTTQARGRPAIFWQTQAAARRANPGGRVPRRVAIDELTVTVDTRERYPYRFAGRPVLTEKAALAAGDYGIRVGGRLVAAVERKTLENLTSSLSDGTLTFQLQRLTALSSAAVVVEAHYADLFRQPGGRASWLADVIARLQVRYPEVAIVFADSRKFAEEWTYRYLAAAAGDAPPATGT